MRTSNRDKKNYHETAERGARKRTASGRAGKTAERGGKTAKRGGNDDGNDWDDGNDGRPAGKAAKRGRDDDGNDGRSAGRGRAPSARERGRPKKKRKKKNFVLNLVLVILALIGLYFLATSDIFAIDKITVKSSGNHFTAATIAEMSGVKKGDNLWKTRTGKAEKRLEQDPYIAGAKIGRKLPGTIEITIREREENYAIAFGNRFAILDWSGMTLRLADEAPQLPLVEGVEVDRAATGSAIQASRELLLADTVKLLEDTEKAGLYFKRVHVTDVGISAYIYDTLSVRGRLENVDASLDKVKLVMLDLKKQKIKRGTIIVGGNGNCTFSPEEQ